MLPGALRVEHGDENTWFFPPFKCMLTACCYTNKTPTAIVLLAAGNELLYIGHKSMIQGWCHSIVYRWMPGIQYKLKLHMIGNNASCWACNNSRLCFRIKVRRDYCTVCRNAVLWTSDNGSCI